MKKYHVGAGLAGIYAGTLKSEEEWKDKSDCTEEAITAVRDFMVDDLLGGTACTKTNKSGYSWKLKDGRNVILEVRIEERDNGKSLHDEIQRNIQSTCRA